MTEPVFICADSPLRAGVELLLTGPEGHHAATVRRLTAGERIHIVDGCGARARAEITRVQGGQLWFRAELIEQEPPPNPRLILVQALTKSDRVDRALEAATELGVHEIWPWQAERSVVQWRAERAEKSRQKWQSTVTAAAKQARRAWVPEVAPIIRSSELPARLATAGAGLQLVILDERARTALAEVFRQAVRRWEQSAPAQRQLLLVVGPEGGIAEDERLALTAIGGQSARLGPDILRAATAGPAALAIWGGLHGWR